MCSKNEMKLNMCSVHTTPGEFKNATITGHFGFVFEDNSVREITWLSWRHRFRKAPFSKRSLSTRKQKAGVLKFLRFQERFWKAPFSWRISVDGRTNCKNKAAFSNSSGASDVFPAKFIIVLWNVVPTHGCNEINSSFHTHHKLKLEDGELLVRAHYLL